MPALLNSVDTALRQRARKVIPGGLWGHLNAANLPDGYPQYFQRADGCRLWDVDGNEYIDFMCSWGPVVLGHHHPVVEEAVRKQIELGACMNGPGEVLVDLAELMVGMIPHADWVILAKNGTDATTTCVTTARAGTGRRKVLVAKGAYHGAAPWCSPSVAGVTTEDRAHLAHFVYNDVASLEAAVEQAKGDLAAIVVSAFRHDLAQDQETATPEFARRARELCDAEGAALIVDDVRAGFRLNLGGSWENLGVRPDMSAFSKAIANGYPLAAVAGNDRFREPATKIFVTGSFWCEAPSMAAALATLTTMRDTNAIGHMVAMGERLRAGLYERAEAQGIAIRQTGPVQMPMVLFENDPGFQKGFAFCSAALRAGTYFHPKHNMFLSTAHTPADIDQALVSAEVGFDAVRRLEKATAA